MHEQVNQRAINHPTKNGASEQQWKFSAGKIVDRSRSQRDDKMQDEPERDRASASAIRPRAEDSGGNMPRNQKRVPGTVDQHGVSHVHDANKKASDKNGRKRPRLGEG